MQAPIHYSNVSLVGQNDSGKQVPVRVAWAWLEDGSKVSLCLLLRKELVFVHCQAKARGWQQGQPRLGGGTFTSAVEQTAAAD